MPGFHQMGYKYNMLQLMTVLKELALPVMNMPYALEIIKCKGLF